jgi:hypothetical protein
MEEPRTLERGDTPILLSNSEQEAHKSMIHGYIPTNSSGVAEKHEINAMNDSTEASPVNEPTSSSGAALQDNDKRLLRVKVLNYFCQGEGLSYNDHFYLIDVEVENLHWQVDRCILDFVELDRKLRKRFPRCSFASLPIAEAALQALYVDLEKSEKLIERQQQSVPSSTMQTSTTEYNEQPLNPSTNEKGTGSMFASSLLSGADGLLGLFFRNNSDDKPTGEGDHVDVSKVHNGNERALSSAVAVNPIDQMAMKLPALNKYLSSVMNQHELLASDELSLFLDQEASAMTVQVAKIQPLSIHDILLLNEPEYKCIVRKREEVTIRIQTNQILLWRFATQDYDIAFSADLNGHTKVSYTRYPSHIAPVCGVLLVDEESLHTAQSAVPFPTTLDSPTKSPKEKAYLDNIGSLTNICSLVFDNTYAKLHTKKLTWSARVVSIDEYQAAKAQAMEVQKERRQFERQRHAFRRVAARVAAGRSGVIHSHHASVVSDYMEEETFEFQELQTACGRLTKEVETLSLEKIEANKARQIAESAATLSLETYKVNETKVAEAVAVATQCRLELEVERTLRETHERSYRDLVTQHNTMQIEYSDLTRISQQSAAELIALKARFKDIEHLYHSQTVEMQTTETAMTAALEQADTTITILEQQLTQAKTHNAALMSALTAAKAKSNVLTREVSTETDVDAITASLADITAAVITDLQTETKIQIQNQILTETENRDSTIVLTETTPNTNTQSN